MVTTIGGEETETKSRNIFSDTIEHLEQEKERHRNDEMTAKGKVIELDELLSRLANTCDTCGKYVYPEYNDKTVRLMKHKEDHIYDN